MCYSFVDTILSHLSPDRLCPLVCLLLYSVGLTPGSASLPPALPGLSQQTEEDGAHLPPAARAPGYQLLTLVKTQLMGQLQGKLVTPGTMTCHDEHYLLLSPGHCEKCIQT